MGRGSGYHLRSFCCWFMTTERSWLVSLSRRFWLRFKTVSEAFLGHRGSPLPL